MKKGRPITKYGKRKSFYLSNEVIAMLERMAKTTGNNKSRYVEILIRASYVPPEEEQKAMVDLIDKEIKGVIG